MGTAITIAKSIPPRIATGNGSPDRIAMMPVT